VPDVVLVVDVANVMGSRPDGWWRDRAGAAARLLAALAPLPGRRAALGPDGTEVAVARVVAVLEGAARTAPDPDDPQAPDGLDVVRAEGSGDDAVVAVAEEVAADGGTPLVVTADRGLRARLPAGALVSGPRTLLAVL
jgi:hypothetical protein